MYESRMIRTKSKKRGKSVRFFRALSDETRVRILKRLLDGAQCVCALAKTFNTSQSRLSFHLRVLKDAGLVVDRPEGRSVYYTLHHKAFKEAEVLIARFKGEYSSMARSASHSTRALVGTLISPQYETGHEKDPRELMKRIVLSPAAHEETIHNTYKEV
jgi:ArsR family transcriptional regulator